MHDVHESWRGVLSVLDHLHLPFWSSLPPLSARYLKYDSFVSMTGYIIYGGE